MPIPVTPRFQELLYRNKEIKELVESPKRKQPIPLESGEVESLMGLSDILPDAVYQVTGSDLAAFASGFLSPSQWLKKGANSVQKLTKGQKIYRGIEKGTEDLAYVNPREVGAHYTTHKETGQKFANKYGDKGQLLEHTSKVNKPFYLEEMYPATWWPHVTAQNILNRGKSKLSAAAKNEIDLISRQWLDDFANIETDNIDDYVAIKDELSGMYNRKIVDVLKQEGYDHISYPNVADEVAEGGKGLESAIIFDREDVE